MNLNGAHYQLFSIFDKRWRLERFLQQDFCRNSHIKHSQRRLLAVIENNWLGAPILREAKWCAKHRDLEANIFDHFHSFFTLLLLNFLQLNIQRIKEMKRVNAKRVKVRHFWKNRIKTYLTDRGNIMNQKYFRGRGILERFSKPCFFTEFENRRLFSTATQQGRKGRDFKLRKKSVAFRVVLISLSL